MKIHKIIREELLKVLLEQEQQDDTSPFSKEEQIFLGKFAESGSKYLGIIYSNSKTGIEEFITRSGAALGCTLPVLHNLLKHRIISIVPYGGYGRNEDFTIRLNIQLDDVESYKGLAPNSGDVGADVQDDIESTTAVDATSIVAGESVMGYKNILIETARIAQKMLSTKKKLIHNEAKVHAQISRTLNRLPSGYLTYLEQIFVLLGKRLHNDLEREYLVADILDNLAHNFGLTPDQIHRSYVYYKSQNRLKHLVKK